MFSNYSWDNGTVWVDGIDTVCECCECGEVVKLAQQVDGKHQYTCKSCGILVEDIVLG